MAEQRSVEWFTARRGKLTASNLGAALGQVSYTSRAEALRRALGTDEFKGNVATEHGTNNEMNGIVDYQIMTGNLVDPTGLWIHPHHTWLAGSPDGLVGEEGMVEIKCPFYTRKDGGRLHKAVPGHYWLQVNALLEITGRKWCDYVCWAPEGMCVYRIHADPQSFQFLLPYYSHFYSAVAARADKPPPLPPAVRAKITERIEFAMQRGVDRAHWHYLYAPHAAPPADVFDDSQSISDPHM